MRYEIENIIIIVKDKSQHAVHLVMICLVCILNAVSFTGALAQSVTQLWFSPSSANIQVDEIKTLTLEVSDGNDLNAYDITVLYDEKVINLDSWSHGSYLSNLAVVWQEVKPGMLHLAVTQVATSGASGDGTLLNLSFKGVSEGKSKIEISDIQLVTSTNQLVNPEIVNGYIEVTAIGSPTITPTVTPTSVLSPTAAPILTSTITQVFTATPLRTATLTITTEVVSTDAPIFLGTPTKTAESVAGHLGQKLELSPGSIKTAFMATSQELLGTAFTTEIGKEENSIAVDRSVDQTEVQNVNSLNKELVNSLLWILFIVLIGTLGGMFLTYTRRKKTG